mgnify:CR=1 FL=1
MNDLDTQTLRARLGAIRAAQEKIGLVLDTFAGYPEWDAHVFGGFPRDLMVSGIDAVPRDLDIVLAKDCIAEVETELSKHVERTTRFGGLHLSLRGWDVDVWSLEQTWAFRSDDRFNVAFEDLPKTTFLDVDAVAVSITGDSPHVHEHGFFDAIRARTVGLNYRPNPYPALCAVRALDIARRLDFSLDAELVSYILETVRRHSTSALIEAQESHFGGVRLQSPALNRMIRTLQERHGTGRGSVRLSST